MKGVAIIAAFVSTVAAHGIITGVTIGDKFYETFEPRTRPKDRRQLIQWTTTNTDHGFVNGTGYQKDDIICHRGATPAALHADAMPGSKIKWDWTCMSAGHHGPVITYMANCNGPCETVDKTKLEFFKIEEMGLLRFGPRMGKAGDWATDELRRNNCSWVTTLPSDIAPGNYVIRHERIALHFGPTLNGAQNYPQCISVKVGGSGTAKPAGAKGTSLYKATDPGIHFDTYNNKLLYPIPGPPLYDPKHTYHVITPSAYFTSTSTTAPPPAPTKPAPAHVTDAPKAPASPTDAPATPADAPATYPETTAPTSTPPASGTVSPPPPGTSLAELIQWFLEALQKLSTLPAASTPVRRHARHYRL